MDWTDFIRGDMGWGAAFGLAVWFSRLVLEGKLVLKREYDELFHRAKTATEKAEGAVTRQSDDSRRTIEAQAEVIKLYREREGQ